MSENVGSLRRLEREVVSSVDFRGAVGIYWVTEQGVRIKLAMVRRMCRVVGEDG